MFAEDYPRFLEVSQLPPRAERLNERYEALFASNRDVFDGARVLDLASHDGRYSFAALKTGAVHVTGVEVRRGLVQQAEETFAFYGQGSETYRFVCGDVFEVLAREKFDVDVVLCLGYLYHTYRHTELLYRLHELAPRYLVLDTVVVPGRGPVSMVHLERNRKDIRHAATDAYSVGRVPVLWPSVPALELLLGAYGFEIESAYDWRRRLAGRPDMRGLGEYATGKRVSLRCRSRDAAVAAGRGPVTALPSWVGPRPPARRRSPTAAAPPGRSTGGWREAANRVLSRVTGYELRRASRAGDRVEIRRRPWRLTNRS